MKIYIPTYLGDIRLTPEGTKTKLSFEAITSSEREKLEQFLKTYCVDFSPWLTKAEIILPEKFTKVHKKFLKVFKAGKGIINAIRFKDGKIEIVQELPAEGFEVGVSVEKPKRGCPMPTPLECAEIQAQEEGWGSYVAPGQYGLFHRDHAFRDVGDGNQSSVISDQSSVISEQLLNTNS